MTTAKPVLSKREEVQANSQLYWLFQTSPVDWPKVFHILDTTGVDPNAKIEAGTISLRAASMGNLDALKELHKRGMPLEGHPRHAKNGDLIHAAAENGHLHVLQWLESQGVNMHRLKGDKSHYGRNLLHIAAMKHNIELAEYALGLGIDVNCPDQEDTTPLHLVVKKGASDSSIQMLNLLIDHEADVNTVDSRGFSALCSASRNNSLLGHARMLFDAGALLRNPKARKNVGFLLHTANPPRNLPTQMEKWQNLPSLQIGEDLTKDALFEKNEYGLTPLDNAETWGQLGRIATILNGKGTPLTKADLMREDGEGRPWAVRAVECRAFPGVQAILKQQGESLHAADFDDGEGELNLLGEAVRNYRVLERDVMNRGYWQEHGGAAGLKHFFRNLPDELKQQVRGIHQLSANVAQDDKQVSVRGR